MSNYYRKLGPDDPLQEGDIDLRQWKSWAMRPTEVDEWHPASEPPKPKDFRPTGQILTIDTTGALDLASERRWKITSQLNIEKHKVAIKSWMHVTPPK